MKHFVNIFFKLNLNILMPNYNNGRNLTKYSKLNKVIEL